MGKMEESENSIKAFTIPYEAWYKDVVILGEPHIQIGMYYEDGSCAGEFKIVWDNIGIQLRAYDDSWEVLRNMPELIDLMGRIRIEELNPTIVEFAEMLKGIGFKDITEREKEDCEYEKTQEFKYECCKKTLIEKISNIIKKSQ